MLIGDAIISALPGLAASFAVGYLYRQAAKPLPPTNSRQRTLRLPRFYMYVGWIGIAIGLLPLSSLVWTTNAWDAASLANVFGIFVLMAGLGGACLVSYYRLTLTYGKTVVRVTGMWGAPREFTWGDIERVGSNAFSGYVHLWVGGEKVRVSGHLIGLRNFIDALEARTRFGHADIDLPI